MLQLIEYLENNVLSDDRVTSRHIVSQSVKGYFVLDGILYYEDGLVPGRRLVVLTQLRRQVLLDNHESLHAGHFAPKKLLQRVNQYYYWPRMSVDVHQVCESCVYTETAEKAMATTAVLTCGRADSSVLQ